MCDQVLRSIATFRPSTREKLALVDGVNLVNTSPIHNSNFIIATLYFTTNVFGMFSSVFRISLQCHHY